MIKEMAMADIPAQDVSAVIPGRENLGILDIIIVLAENKERIIGVVLLTTLLAAGLSLLIPNRYTARTQILPPQSQSGSSAILGQLGALTGLSGASMGLKSPSDTYLGLLNSRRVKDSLIQRFKLQTTYDTKLPTETRRQLEKSTNIVSEKSGMITVEVTDNDPVLAAALANGYIEDLQQLTKILSVTEASQRRLFFEKQLQQAKEGLSEAEIALKKVQEKTGLIQLTGQASSIIQAVSGLKAQIAAKEVALAAMRTFATIDNPEYIRTQQEISALRAQLQKAETGTNAGNGDISVATSKVPELGLEYVRRVRDVKYYETIFELIAKQFELAKIDEAKEGSLLQVLDDAVIPDKKSGPARVIIVAGAAFVAGFLMIVWSFFKAATIYNPAVSGQLGALRKSMQWRFRRASGASRGD